MRFYFEFSVGFGWLCSQCSMGMAWLGLVSGAGQADLTFTIEVSFVSSRGLHCIREVCGLDALAKHAVAHRPRKARRSCVDAQRRTTCCVITSSGWSSTGPPPPCRSSARMATCGGRSRSTTAPRASTRRSRQLVQEVHQRLQGEVAPREETGPAPHLLAADEGAVRRRAPRRRRQPAGPRH